MNLQLIDFSLGFEVLESNTFYNTQTYYKVYFELQCFLVTSKLFKTYLDIGSYQWYVLMYQLTNDAEFVKNFENRYSNGYL